MTLRKTLRVVATVAVAALLGACDSSTTAPSTAPRYSTIYVFGASLEDTGNSCNLSTSACPPAPPYAVGRYSNGPLWVELIAQGYGATVAPSRTGGNNYAFAGARTGPITGTTQGVPNMLQQVDQFLAAPATSSGDRGTALFVVGATTVGNDINDALTQSVANPSAPATILTAAVANTVTIVNRLYAAGARNILVMNSTDVGRTPLVRSQGALAAAGATALSTQFNTALAGQLPAIRAASPRLNLVLLDIGALTTEVFANPTAFGFTTLTAPCYLTAAIPRCAAPDAYFYWDGFHPTAAAGRLVSRRVFAALGS